MLPLRPNFYPYATELRKWMLRQPCLLPIFPADDPVYTNPYSKDAAVLTAAYIRVTNDSGTWTAETDALTWVSAETQRVRFYSEFVLYTTRLVEALTKQLLFCTNFEMKDYRRAAIGALLLSECRPCKKAKQPHGISYLGSLAHHYQLCAGYDNCLEKDLPKLNALRNKLAAHAGTWELRRIDTSATRNQLHDASIETGELFLHMLLHLSEIEIAMRDEIFAGLRRHVGV